MTDQKQEVLIPYGASELFCELARRHLAADTVNVSYGYGEDEKDGYKTVLKLCKAGRKYSYYYSCNPYANHLQCKNGTCDHDKWEVISESDTFYL
jgi:hypothetical protein